MRCNSCLTKGWLPLLVAVVFGTLSWGVASEPPTHNTFVYVLTASTEASYVSQFQVARNGKLRPLNPPTVPVGNNATSLTVSPDGNYLYLLDNGDAGAAVTFLRFSINRNGTLASNPVTSTGPVGFAYPLTLSRDGKLALVPLGSTVISYSIDASGEFTMVSDVAAGNNACIAAIDPTGQFAYVGNCSDQTISEYTIAPNGELTSNGLVSTSPISVYFLAFAPNGFLYSAGCCALDGLTRYVIDPSTGTITQTTSFPIGHIPYSFAFNSTGTRAYTANADGGASSVSSLRVNRATGALAKKGPDIPISGGVSGQIALDPSGRFAILPTPTLQAGVTGKMFLYRINGSGSLLPNGAIPLDAGTNETSGTIAFTTR